MIDIWEVAANGLWVAGLAVLLAAFSWAWWTAHSEGGRLRAVLGRPAIRLTLDTGGCLFCAGIAAAGGAWWERILWGGLALAWAVQAGLNARRSSKRTGEGDGTH